MKIIIIYDSFYGNTQQIAQAIGKGFDTSSDTEILRVSQVNPDRLTGLTLFIVGSPTRAFQATPAIKKLLRKIPGRGLKGVKVAAFDTRISPDDVDASFLRMMIKVFGYAADPIARKLKQKGGELILAPEGFIVNDTEGPLREGELQRAMDWGRQMMNKM